jgi:hypothetical protein
MKSEILYPGAFPMVRGGRVGRRFERPLHRHDFFMRKVQVR